jgi:hypothetical protein
LGFWQILANIGIIAGIASGIATIAGYFASANASTKQKLMLVGVPLAIIFIGAGVLSLLYASMPQSAGTITSNGNTTSPSPTHQDTSTGNGNTTSLSSLAPTYQGTITDTDALNTTSEMFLCAVTQSANNIAGAVKLSLFSGSGPFTGTINSNNSVRFSIVNADDGYGPSDFNGFINPDGSMNGRYINHNLNQQGTWQVKPATGSSC